MLGWKRASRLPGYFGNLFVPANEVAGELKLVEEILGEVDLDEFMQKLDRVTWGCSWDVSPKFRSLLPSALETVLKEGNGLLALNYPEIGAIPYPDDEAYEDG